MGLASKNNWNQGLRQHQNSLPLISASLCIIYLIISNPCIPVNEEGGQRWRLLGDLTEQASSGQMRLRESGEELKLSFHPISLA